MPELPDESGRVESNRAAWDVTAAKYETDVERNVARLLAPGGRLFVYEGHPLDWVWEHKAATYEPRADGTGYFDRTPRVNRDIPGLFIYGGCRTRTRWRRESDGGTTAVNSSD